MRRMLVVLGLVFASMGLAPAAFGACAGTANTVVVCVNPTGGVLYEDCVYPWPKPPGCLPVTVPGPTLQCGGEIGEELLQCS